MGFPSPAGLQLVATIIAMGEEIPNCRWRWRNQALSNPSRSPSSMICGVDWWPEAGFTGSNKPIVRNPSLRNGCEVSGMGFLQDRVRLILGICALTWRLV
jgi:hypothetical protein